MRVKLKNVGDSVRVLHNAAGTAVSIGIGQEVVADLRDATITKIKEAQEKGDTLLLSSASERVRVVKDGDDTPAKKAASSKSRSAPKPKPKSETPKTETVERDVQDRRQTPPPKEPDDKHDDGTDAVSAIEALKLADSYDYHSLLSIVSRLVPEAKLGPRPTRVQMIDVLREKAKEQG